MSDVCCQVELTAMGQSLIHRSPAMSGVSKVGLHEAALRATYQQVQSPASNQATSKVAMPVTCRNEKAVQ